MLPLTLNLFGDWTFATADGSPVTVAAEKERALLAFLALESDRPQPRERVAGLLWPGTTEFGARQSLSHALYSLNRLVVPPVPGGDPPLIVATRSDLRIRPGVVGSDVQAFEQHLLAWHDHGHAAGALCEACAERLRRALELYRGELLSGLRLVDCPEYGEWLAVRRERYHRQAVQAAMALAVEQVGEQGLTYARRWVALDPLDEAGHRRVMLLLANVGQRTQALEQYEDCRRFLQRELGVDPEQATQSLCERILAGEVAPMAAAAERRPVARQPARAPHNLPYPVDSFVGREREMADVRSLLSDSSVRLVTLVGAGGTGKTRLALEVARACLDRFADGVWFVDLAPLKAMPLPGGLMPAASQPAASGVGQALAEVLAVRAVAEEDLTAALVTALQDRRLLLIIDNCEHVLGDAAAMLSVLRACCATLTLLATSREPLRIPGEQVYEVPALNMPEGSASGGESVPLGLEEALAYDAVRLLVERGGEARYGSTIDETNVGAAVEICRRLDGMPLAIELAAARLNALSLGEIASRLDGQLDGRLHGRWALLGAGSRAAHSRQRTMLNTVAWSYGLLGEEERLLFDRLSVFAGSFSLEAIAAVCSGEGVDGGQFPVLLAALVDCSLVQRLEVAGASRYRLLETLRAYGQERLAERGEQEAIARSHAEFFASIAERAAPVLRHGEPDYFRVLQSLTPDRDNLETAIRWSLRSGTGVEALRITGAAHFWAIYRTAAETYVELALAAHRLTESRPDARDLALQRSRALGLVANQYCNRYLLEDLENVSSAGLAAAREAGDPVAIAWALHWRGRGADARGESGLCTAALNESLNLARVCGEAGLIALNESCLLEYKPNGTRPAFADAILERTPPGWRAFVCGQLAQEGAYRDGDLARAERYRRESVNRWAELGDLRNEGTARRELALLLVALGRMEEAEALLEQAGPQCRRSGDGDGYLMCTWMLCDLAWKRGEGRAGALLDACLHRVDAMASRLHRNVMQARLARVAAGLGRHELARDLVEGLLREPDLSPGLAGMVHEARGWNEFLSGDAPGAVGDFCQALACARSDNWRTGIAAASEHLAWALAAAGEREQAVSLLGSAASERVAMGVVLPPVEVPHHDRAVALVEKRL